jgi:hypothetical protein
VFALLLRTVPGEDGQKHRDDRIGRNGAASSLEVFDY